MAGYIGQGLGYSKLSAPEDGLSQSLQFWGGQAGQRKAAADLAAERAKVRADEAKAAEEERKRKEVKEKDWTAEYRSSGFSTPDAMGYEAASKFQTAYANLIPQYKEALDSGDEKRRAEIDAQMKAIKRNMGSYQDVSTRLKATYDGLKAKRDSGQMSPYYEDVWNTIQKFTTGDTQNAWVDVDPNTYEYRISYKEIGEDGTEVVKTVDPNMFINGTMNAVDKVDTETIARTLAEKAGKFKQEYYKNNRDITTEGFNLEFEKYLDKNIEESLSDKDVVAWAGEFRGERYGTLNGNTAKIAEYRKEMKEDIKKKIMGYEDVVDSKKLNLEEERLKLEKEREARLRAEANKPPKGDEEKQKYGVRQYNIAEVMRSGNLSDFKSGDIVIGGQKMTIKDAMMNSDGKSFTITAVDEKGKTKLFPFDMTEAGINEAYNTLEIPENERDQWGLDKVYDPTIQQHKWRSPLSTGTKSYLPKSFLDSSFNSDGQYINANDDDVLISSLKKEYPEAEIENNVVFGYGDITINGEPIYLDDRTADDINNQIGEALSKSTKTKKHTQNRRYTGKAELD